MLGALVLLVTQIAVYVIFRSANPLYVFSTTLFFCRNNASCDLLWVDVQAAYSAKS